MKSREFRIIGFFMPLLMLFPSEGRSQGKNQSAEEVVRDMYALVTFTPDKPTDWDKVKAHFVPSANVFLRVTRDSSHVFTVDGFVDDFIKFDEQPGVKQRGFSENVVKAISTEFGNIAHVLVLYEAHITGSQRPPQRGVDSWQLIRDGGEWKILSVTNEIPNKDRPLPKMLQD